MATRVYEVSDGSCRELIEEGVSPGPGRCESNATYGQAAMVRSMVLGRAYKVSPPDYDIATVTLALFAAPISRLRESGHSFYTGRIRFASASDERHDLLAGTIDAVYVHMPSRRFVGITPKGAGSIQGP